MSPSSPLTTEGQSALHLNLRVELVGGENHLPRIQAMLDQAIAGMLERFTMRVMDEMPCVEPRFDARYLSVSAGSGA